MLYAIVPLIRYVEHGLRHVRADVVEAVEQMGATPVQTLLQAKPRPQADQLPEGEAGIIDNNKM
ncbi:hypothetical protein EH240_31680 [Mesorhizobium tamadayense]|uniref:Uncharacterized protein n=1 Tax=Mesorhizobium tamadayense TaxID=425306 RepID=A0A3P3F0X6_9HYPH|nr:hypothetical protein [Mesorhizobium tamadayense]RRH91906.1 hypothetical protein EH240_31680 [Mesorhizobium tamadayense]